MNTNLTPKRIAAVLAATALLTAGAVGAAYATSTGDDGQDRPITGVALERAERAALAETGEGRVTDTEVDDEDSKYEVEVTLEDGTEVDVQLDGQFRVVGTERDAAGSDDG